ncbi:MAG: hypothetical protein HUJ25_03515 [Crocinitomicaceae bacterium]|nr:hypothetical protein [Crocinitomicaceae bacterium]
MTKQLVVIIFLSGITLAIWSSCKKYDEGPAISLRTKMNRFTGKWKVVNIEGKPMLSNEQFIEFTEENNPHPNGDVTKYYLAIYDNFQMVKLDDNEDSLFSGNGYWRFFLSEPFVNGDCDDTEEMHDKEMILTTIDFKLNGDFFKILRLTNKELKFQLSQCSYDQAEIDSMVDIIYELEKVK